MVFRQNFGSEMWSSHEFEKLRSPQLFFINV